MNNFVNVLLEKRNPEDENKVSLFDSLNLISKPEKERYDWKYENNLTSEKKKIEIDGDYSQRRTNFVLCNYRDLIFIVNEINLHYNVTDQMHYDYLYNSIRKQNRWYKRETEKEKKDREKKEELITLVCKYYKYNAVRAREVLDILTPEQVKKIRKGKEKGGVK